MTQGQKEYDKEIALIDSGKSKGQKEYDLRKYNGGARPGSGPKLKPEEEKKVTVAFQIKRKHVEKAKVKIQPIVDKINRGV